MATEASRYREGQKLVHPGHGGCTIVAITQLDCGDGGVKYYALQPIADKDMIVYVPVNKLSAVGIRELATKTAVEAILASLPGQEEPWISDHRNRMQTYNAVFLGEDAARQAGILKLMIVMNEKKTLMGMNLDLLRSGRKKLISEFAMSMELEIEDMDKLFEEACHAKACCDASKVCPLQVSA